jgi:hypothetical protein
MSTIDYSNQGTDGNWDGAARGECEGCASRPPEEASSKEQIRAARLIRRAIASSRGNGENTRFWRRQGAGTAAARA